MGGHLTPLSGLSAGRGSNPRPTIRRIGVDGQQTIVAGGVPVSAFQSFPCASNPCGVQSDWLAEGPDGDLYISQGDEGKVVRPTPTDMAAKMTGPRRTRRSFTADRRVSAVAG